MHSALPRQEMAPLLSPLGVVLVDALVNNKGDGASMEGLSLATRAEFAKSPLMGAIREAGRVKVLEELHTAVAKNEDRSLVSTFVEGANTPIFL